MSNKGHHSNSDRDRRVHRHRARTPHRLPSDGSAAASTASRHPSTSVGRTSSTRLTSPSDTLMSLGPASPPNQHPTPHFAGAFDPYRPQPAYGFSQFDPGHDLNAPSGPNQGCYATPSPEPADYASPGSSDDMAASTIVYPPSPPKAQRAPAPDENKTKEKTKKKEKKKRSERNEPAPVFAWRPDPGNGSSAHGNMANGYQTYSIDDRLGFAGAPGQQTSFSMYPTAIADADFYEPGDTVAVNNQGGPQCQYQQQGEDDWEMVNGADSL